MRLASTPVTHCNQSNIPLCNTTDVIQTGKPWHIKARCPPLLSTVFCNIHRSSPEGIPAHRKLANAPAQQSKPPVAEGALKGNKQYCWRNHLEMELLMRQWGSPGEVG